MQQQNDQQKLNLQKIAQAKALRKQELIEQAMKEMSFPACLISNEWITVMNKAMINCCPMTQRCLVEDFADALHALATCGTSLNLQQFQIVANSLDAVCPQTLGLDPWEYKGVGEAHDQDEYRWSSC